MIFLQINNNISSLANAFQIDEGLLESAAQKTLEFTNAPSGVDLSIVLTDDAQLRELNHQFLGIDAPTDVLAFPSSEVDRDTGKKYLGDVLISIERAQAQAVAAGHTYESELCLLIVHGVLHLLGYDHADEDQKAAMWSAQEKILSLLGLQINPVDTSDT